MEKLYMFSLLKLHKLFEVSDKPNLYFLQVILSIISSEYLYSKALGIRTLKV